MLSTALIHEQEQYLKLSEEKPGTPSHNIAENLEAAPDLDAIRNTLFQKVFPFRYRGRVSLSFLVQDQYKADFILIKGLMEFHRPKEFRFTYDRNQKSITIDIENDQLEELELFLSSISKWVRHEKQFRHALKIALEFENRYRLERESIYEQLKNTTVAARAVY